MKIKEIIINGANELKEKNVQDSNIRARILLQYVLQQDKNYLIVNSEKKVDEKEERVYNQHIQELIKGKPLQYITHIQEFMGLDFYVDENVLIPQPDTEILVDEAIKAIEGKIDNIDTNQNEKNVIKVLDMCTGSGAIATSIAKYFQDKNINEENLKIEIYALDISEEALKIAEKNAKTNGVHVTFFKSNMFEEIEKNTKGKFDVIVSNPPYIETATIPTLSNEVQQEPHIALDGGKDGLDFYKIIAKEGNKYLNENGAILLEIGYNQKESVTKLFEKMQEYTRMECIQDLAGNDRVVKMNRG